MMITGAMRTTPTKELEMFSNLPPLGTEEEAAAFMAAYRLPRPNSKNLEIGHTRIWVKAEEVGSKFNVTKDHTTLRRTFAKYRLVIPTREEKRKTDPNN